MKTCPRCKTEKPLGEFGTHARPDRNPEKRYVNSRCRPCARDEWDRDKARNASLQRRYGLTSEQFTEMLARQGGCGVCGRKRSNGKYWHVDHDHECCPGKTSCGKCVRGILCHGCNTALGNVSDNTEILKAMIAYVEASRVR